MSGPAGQDEHAGRDLRLAGAALGVWLSALACLYATTALAMGIAAAAALAAGGLAASARFRSTVDRMAGGRPAGWVVVGLLIGVLCGAAATGARLSVRDSSAVAEPVRERARVEVELVVGDDPRPLAGSAGRPPSWLVPAELRSLRRVERGPRIDVDARILVIASDPAWGARLPGERLRATGRLQPPRGGDLRAAVLSASTPPERVGRVPLAQRLAGSLRDGLQRACAPLADEPGGLLPGLVVGDTSRLLPEVADDFRATGMSHLVAVSGANVAIVIGAVLLLARWCRAGPWLAGVACAAALLGFVILARPSPSVVRAAAMGAIGLAGLVAGRPRAALPALCAAIVALVLVDPELAGDAGFALSVLATGGLLVLAPRWRDGLVCRGVPRGAAEMLVVPAAAQVACTPVVAALSGAVSLVAVPANLLAVPAVAPATVLGVMAALLSPLWPTGAEFLAWLGGFPATWLVTVARIGAAVPAGALPWPDGVVGGGVLAVLTVALLVAARRPLVRRLCLVVAVAAVLGAVPVRLLASGWPPPGWVLVACSVGQGDAVVLPVTSGQAVVVDAGPEPAATDRCLRRLGVRAVPLLVITHFHADHIGGIDGVFRGRTVSTVLVPPYPAPPAGRAAVARTARVQRAEMRDAAAGWSTAVGPLRLTVVGPVAPMSGTRSDPNNNSLIVRVDLRDTVVLLAGDAEGEEQRALLGRLGPAGVRAGVLKVAHHGSAYQEAEFLDAVDPAVAVVSVGTGNVYGHPNGAVLARLSSGGARVLRTDLDGDVAAVLTDSGLAVAVRGPDG